MAGHRRPMVHLVSVVAAVVEEADRVMPAMEDTNTNPDTCSSRRDDLRAQSRRLPSSFPDGTSRVIGSIDPYIRASIARERPILIKG